MTSGISFVLGLACIVAGVFISVVGFVSVVKILQIAEDLRYLRSKSDLSVSRPKSYKNTLVVCLIASLIVCFIVIGFLLTFSAGIMAGRFS